MAIEHFVTFRDRAGHHLEITSHFPLPSSAPHGADAVELFMPVWTPGSYLVREFARHLEAFTAADGLGRPLAAVKVRKNRWRIILPANNSNPRDETPETRGVVIVRYRLYARDLTVRTNFVDEEQAILAGAATFLCPCQRLELPHRVTIELPNEWSSVETALPRIVENPGPDGHQLLTFSARDYDELVDSPITCGSPAIHDFVVSGRRHRVAHFGTDPSWPFARAAADLPRIVAAQHTFWGNVPYGRYLFVNLLAQSTGGLEHADSTVLLTPRFGAATRKGYLDWLGLASHELFHAWNGKRLRPQELGPFDYENEVYTRDLWVVEGITSYYDDLLVVRAGLATSSEYLAALSRHLEMLRTVPGRRVQSLSDASFDSWIKYYRPDENTADSGVSYYGKGAVVAWLLDMAIRVASADQRSLDHLMRLAYERFSGPSGFTSDDFRVLVEEVAGASLGAFLSAAIDHTDELDLTPALDWLGLRLAPAPGPPAQVSNGSAHLDGGQTAAPRRGWLGWTLRREADGRVVAVEVRRETPAAASGVSAGDELIGLQGFRVPAAAWDERVAALAPGSTVELLVARRDRLVHLALTIGEEPTPLRLEPDPAASSVQRARFADWLGGHAAGGSTT